jgi:lipid-A-disaccharide synthase-like uncharacterized protein
MDHLYIYALGFFAQSLFASRMIIQWFQSERAGRVTSPTLFWQTSLVACFLFLLYGILRHDLIIVFGQLLSSFIYMRNLQLQKAWGKMSSLFKIIIFVLPAIIIVWIFSADNSLHADFQAKNSFSNPWLIIGASGQLLLNVRFIYQWYCAEKYQLSFFPKGFWIISVAGSLLVFVYAIYRVDPVLLVAQSLGFFIYSRNIILEKRNDAFSV